MSFTEFYVRPGGSNLNAGSTDADSPAFTTAGGDWVQSTRVFTKTGAISGVNIGDFASVYADGASAPTGYVARVTGVTSDTITLSSTALSGSAPTDGTANRTIRVGGAWGGSADNDISHAFTFPAAAMVDVDNHPMRVNIKSGTWNVTSAITRTASGPAYFMGYTSAAGDATSPVVTIDSGTNAIVPLTISASSHCLAFLEFVSTATTGTNALVTSGSGVRTVAYRCRFVGARGSGLTGAGLGLTAIECEAINCNKSNSADLCGIVASSAIRCVSHDHTSATTNGNGFACFFALGCIADRCNGAGFLIGQNAQAFGCSSYNCINGAKTNSGSTPMAFVEGCNFVLNSTNGFNSGSLSYVLVVNNCAFRDNTSGKYNSTATAIAWEPVASTDLASNPYTDVATGSRPTAGDFTILSTAGLGRGAGSGSFLQSSSYYSSTTTSYPDRGAVQHQEVAGGGLLRHPGTSGGLVG